MELLKYYVIRYKDTSDNKDKNLIINMRYVKGVVYRIRTYSIYYNNQCNNSALGYELIGENIKPSRIIKLWYLTNRTMHYIHYSYDCNDKLYKWYGADLHYITNINRFTSRG